jgi:hypothetical protein
MLVTIWNIHFGKKQDLLMLQYGINHKGSITNRNLKFALMDFNIKNTDV